MILASVFLWLALMLSSDLLLPVLLLVSLATLFLTPRPLLVRFCLGLAGR